MPVELLYAEKFMQDDLFAVQYAIKTISDITGKTVDFIEFLLNKRKIKINAMLSLNGFKVCITGKSGGGRQIGVQCLTTFKTSCETEAYIKRLESFDNKRKKNNNIVFCEKYDGINSLQNLALYDSYIDKLQNTSYQYRPANPLNVLLKGREKFILCSIENQVSVLLSIQGLFGRVKAADLSAIGGAPTAGVAALSSIVSNWKNNYSDVRIIDQSASGLFEKVSDNLIELL